MSSLPGEQVPRGAARKVLCAALKLKSGDRIALFYDESTEEVANFFCEAASDLGVQFQKHLIRIAEQKAYALSQDGSPDLEFLAGYQAVLTCLTDNAECALFRQHLVTQCVAEDRKVGHMPGVNEEILREALNIDYSSAEQICDDLALILAVGRFGV